MKKTSVLFLILLIASVTYISGQEVDVAETELLTVRDTTVEFINYEGPHLKIETVEEIMSVGMFLGESIGTGYSTAEYGDKYRVIHAVGESPDEGLDADIFMVLENAQVDHIQNMRYILAGLVIAAYGYEREDALLLAEFVTIYNAVHRGKMDFLGGKYKQIVTRNLRPDAAGISTLYSDWPGMTEMVIPLTEDAANGGLGSLDTDTLTEDEVIEEMRSQPDRGLESRKEITELKEREVEEEQQEIEEERQVIEEEREQIAAERERIDREREEVEEEREQADTPTERAQADRREEELDRQEEQLEAEEAELEEQEQELAEREQEQAERVDRIQSEREEIAADERELMEEAAEEEETEIAATGARAAARVVVYLEVRDLGGEPLGGLVHIDSAAGAITGASTLNSIRNRRFESLGPYYVVVAGTTAGQGAVRLMTVDKDSLETVAEGDRDIYPDSALLADGASVYAITNTGAGDGTTWTVAKFDNSLNLRENSQLEVYPDTALSVSESVLYVVGADGMIHALSTSDLSDTGSVR